VHRALHGFVEHRVNSVALLRGGGLIINYVYHNKDVECELRCINGTYGIPDTLLNHRATQDELGLCEKSDGGDHPWHGVDFDEGLMSQF
jgi:hypothetical protein